MPEWTADATILIVVLLAIGAVMYFSLTWLTGFGVRTRIKQFLRERGNELVRIGWIEGRRGYTVSFREGDDVRKVNFRRVFGGHLHVFTESRNPSKLIYFATDGSINVHELPNKNLANGRWPHHHTRIAESASSSLCAGVVVFVLTIFAVAFLIVPAIDWTIQTVLGSSPPTSHFAQLLRFCTTLLYVACTFAPFATAVWTYRHKRYELHTSDAPIQICRQCGYDLKGNVSGVCSECGTPSLLCRQCGYDLRGNVSGVCSECGTPAPHIRRQPV